MAISIITRRLCAAALLGSMAGEAGAQTLCTLADSGASCQAKVEAEMNARLASESDARDAARAHTAEQLARANTGAAPSASPDAATTFTDFFTTLKAAASAGTGDDEDDALGFEFGRCLRERVETSPLQCQIRVRVGGGTLFEPLRQALPEANREARADELEAMIGRHDNVTAGVFFNLIGERWGRVPRFGDDPLFDAIWSVVGSGSTEAANAASDAYLDVHDEIVGMMAGQSPPVVFDQDTPFSVVAAVDQALAEEALALREAAWRAEYWSMDDMRRRLDENGYFDLVRLVNNQPQLSFGFEYTQRAPLAGPDEWRAKLVWEKGFVNVNSAREAVFATSGADDDEQTVARLRGYLGREDVRRRLANGDRLALSIEAVERRSYAFDLVPEQIGFRQSSEHSLIGSVSYGYYLDFDGTGQPMSRLDIKADYEDVSSDSARQDRGTLSVTFSQRVLGSTVLAVSLVYGTKPEFRGEVDEELSARLGFNYKWGEAGAL